MNEEIAQMSENRFKSLCRVGLENFRPDVLSESRPVLLLCMPEDSDFTSQLAEIEKIQLDYRQALKVCYLEENFLGVFMERYKVAGTPTLLVFVEGTERERLLGRVSYQELSRFLKQLLPDVRNGLS